MFQLQSNTKIEILEKKNLQFIRQFYFYIGLLPYYDENFILYSNLFRYIKPIIITTFIISLGVIKTVHDGSLQDDDMARVYLTLVSSSCTLFTIVMCVIKFSTWQAPKLARLFTTIQDTDVIFQQLKQPIPMVHCKWMLLLLFSIYLMVSSLGAYAFKNIPVLYIVLGGVDHTALLYVGFINVFVMQLLLMAKLRFRSLNRFLQGLTSSQVNTSCVTIEIIVNLHNMVCNICEMIQGVFGWHLLFFYFHQMMFTLSSLHLSMTSFSATDMATTLYCTLGLVTSQGIILAVLCDVVSAEGRKTASIICDYVNMHPHANSLILSKMKFFLQQSKEKMPKFTAAAFFPVDNSLIFMFINLTATYVIVLIQFLP